MKSPRGWSVPVAPAMPDLDAEGAASLSFSEGKQAIPEMMVECESPAMVFIHPQKWHGEYDMETGLERGTIFPQLDLPFLGEGACRR